MIVYIRQVWILWQRLELTWLKIDYFCPTRDYLDKNLEKQSLCVDVDTSRLISKVYISPYISESTAKKIKRKLKLRWRKIIMLVIF